MKPCGLALPCPTPHLSAGDDLLPRQILPLLLFIAVSPGTRVRASCSSTSPQAVKQKQTAARGWDQACDVHRLDASLAGIHGAVLGPGQAHSALTSAGIMAELPVVSPFPVYPSGIFRAWCAHQCRSSRSAHLCPGLGKLPSVPLPRYTLRLGCLQWYLAAPVEMGACTQLCNG